ncbi:ABC transporter substrate-binding protein [Planotetraspora sp. A-T 1434]|uniref:ABC transporter substrate-binding protein n=1 Tax=Planotetraspora sp. A-T 1434 TaxID=2979219 RepID=UPI0021BFF15B|nr:ABC transporter substrate-binding protein [Planotetraspora sp. A-T 1434]MCT9935032.1 ABC transporter substrate-binding protein [Planotetraspora sp. A-T 1434]
MTRRSLVVATLSGALLLGVAACGGGSTSTSPSGGSTGEAAAPAAADAFNAGIGKVFNPSDKKGGVIKFAISDDFDSVDPADTYYGFAWDFLRVYGRSLVTYKPAPGQEGNQVVPDLAESLGQASDDNKTWTYKLRTGVKFEDGTPVKSADVKYAVLRSLDKKTFPNGPTYFNDWLDLPKDFVSVYKTPDVKTDSAIETPDDQTIVFHLKKGYAGFDNFAALPGTIPVPQAKDTGVKYREHVVATGPYMFKSAEAGKGYSLVRNPNWDQATDQIRKALPDGYEIEAKANADDLDNRLISGDVQVDLAGTGVQPAALSRVLGDPALKARSDNPTAARTWYWSIIGDVKPLDNLDCRKAIQFAADKVALQTAYNGPFAGGDIATSLMPPSIAGHQDFNLYPAGADNHGDVAKAKEALTACGQPNGFAINAAYRADRPKEKQAGEALQQALARVGIKLTLKGYPAGDYFALYAGKPSFNKENNIGLAANGWGADWNDGFGFLSQIVDSRTIREAGNYNMSVKDPAVDALIDKAMTTADATARNGVWAEVDKKVMEDSYVLPAVWAKALTVRGKGLTNVFVNDAYGLYDYLALGVQ